AVFQGGLNGPIRTIQQAVRVATQGATIVVAPSGVPYREALVIDGYLRQDPSRFPLVIEGNGAEVAGDVPLLNEDWLYIGGGVYRWDRAFRAEGLLFHGGAQAPRGTGALWGDEPPALEPGQFGVWRGAYFFRVGSGQDAIDRYPLSETHLQAGLTIYRSNNLVFRNLVFRGYRLDGVRVHGPSKNIRFDHCSFVGNGRAGFSAVRNAEVVLNGCAATGNVESGLIQQDLATLELRAVDLTGNGGELTAADETRVVKTAEPGPFQFTRFLLPGGAAAKVAPEGSVEVPASEATPGKEPAPSAPAPKAKKPSFFD
ncbi:MAG: right-handed parallel beta-helix repeat-containing protein, partial [Planctomycetia bacterium]